MNVCIPGGRERIWLLVDDDDDDDDDVVALTKQSNSLKESSIEWYALARNSLYLN